MPESHVDPIGPVQPVGGAPSVQPVRPEPRVPARDVEPNVGQRSREAAKAAEDHSGAYSELVVNPDTHDVIVRIRDAVTDRVLNEYPSTEVEHLALYLKQYSETLARRRAAAQPKP